MQTPASLRSDRRQLSPGMGGRRRVDQVAAFTPESVAAFSGIRNLVFLFFPSRAGSHLREGLGDSPVADGVLPSPQISPRY